MKTWRDIPGWFTEAGANFFAQAVNEIKLRFQPPYHFVELGTYLGRSCICMLELLKDVPHTMTCIDAFSMWSSKHRLIKSHPTPLPVFYQNLIDCGFSYRNVHILQSATDKVTAIQPQSCHFIYIDAGHEYTDVHSDITKYRPYILPGGIMCGHDYTAQYPGLIKAVNELVPNRILIGDDTWVDNSYAKN